ncbi:MAG: helix-turn-helix domain-containing protein [Acidobacteria bacterium]|nr:helix-turn-helix domain-containing protein [Acidobacteriota bacterium]
MKEQLLLESGNPDENIIDAIYDLPDSEIKYFSYDVRPCFAVSFKYSLDDISNNPQLAEEISNKDAKELWLRIIIAQSSLAPRLLTAPTEEDESKNDQDSDEYLTPQEVAKIMKVPLSWIYRHASKFGGEKFGRKCLRIRKSKWESYRKSAKSRCVK